MSQDLVPRNEQFSSSNGDDDSDNENDHFVEEPTHKHTFVRRGSSRNLKGFETTGDLKEKHPQMWDLMSTYLSNEPPDIKQFIVNHIEYTIAHSRYNFDDFSTYQGTAYSLRDRMIEYWNDTQQYFTEQKVKRVYYLSIEYLIGRSMQNSVINLGLKGPYSQALSDLGYKLEDLYEHEQDAALGNGGLGRLAACFLDSLATLNYPAWGYGIRYQYGMLHQEIRNGYQVEQPDFWLSHGNPWEVPRIDVAYPVRFYGAVRILKNAKGQNKFIWEGGETVKAVAYDHPVPGFETRNVLNLRLWNSQPSTEIDFQSFQQEDYYGALKARQNAQNITSVLYPNDKTSKGKELRLKQQYFFVSASLRDILRRFKKLGKPLSKFPDYVAIQLNDTHPTISVPELMHILVDDEDLDWEDAWKITTKTFAFTNHTVLPEALEHWSVELLGELLPRHLQIIYEINKFHLEAVTKFFNGDQDKLRGMSLIEESSPKMVRMAHLAIVASHSVNGVAMIHSEIIKKTIFSPFYEMTPAKFNNKTNGVTPRRWIVAANPELATLITETLGNRDWITNLPLVDELKKHADDEKFQQRFSDIKLKNKIRLKNYIAKITNGEVVVSENALFDVHIKRIHEYKRQLLNILSVIARYNVIKRMSKSQKKNVVPRVHIFAGKAAPGYYTAKVIIKLINSVAEVVNRDADIQNLLKVVFIPNYNVSVAEIIIPANDVSQHVSTAGTEASGTSNMKFCMNGGLIIGTLDGANIEIREEAGDDNMFVFGAVADEVAGLRSRPPTAIDERMYNALQSIASGQYGPYSIYEAVLEPLYHGNDYYLLGCDFTSYMEAIDRVDKEFLDKKNWVRKCIVTTASMGKFSSDTTIHNYAKEIWGVKPCKVPSVANSTAAHK